MLHLREAQRLLPRDAETNTDEAARLSAAEEALKLLTMTLEEHSDSVPLDAWDETLENIRPFARQLNFEDNIDKRPSNNNPLVRLLLIRPQNYYGED